jgi:hypothetical protein
VRETTTTFVPQFTAVHSDLPFAPLGSGTYGLVPEFASGGSEVDALMAAADDATYLGFLPDALSPSAGFMYVTVGWQTILRVAHDAAGSVTQIGTSFAGCSQSDPLCIRSVATVNGRLFFAADGDLYSVTSADSVPTSAACTNPRHLTTATYDVGGASFDTRLFVVCEGAPSSGVEVIRVMADDGTTSAVVPCGTSDRWEFVGRLYGNTPDSMFLFTKSTSACQVWSVCSLCVCVQSSFVEME